MKGTKLHIEREGRYRVRLLSALAVAELLMLAVFHFGPVAKIEQPWRPQQNSGDVEFQQVEVTRHSDIPASPPKPAVPLRLPEDKIVEEELKINPLQREITVSEDLGEGKERGSEEGKPALQPVDSPDQSPQLYKIVEPEMPEEARKANIKVIIEVQFLINEKGQVEEASIAQIKLYEDGKDPYKVVDHINYGLTQATLSAALQWKFRPAVKNGKKVPSYSKHSFTYGF